MFDSHVHSSFSGDSEMPAEQACEKAIELGLKGIAFTDHLDYDFPNYSDLFMINFDEYTTYMDELKKKYSNKIKVLKSIEIGIQRHTIEDTLKIVEKYDFDFVLSSVHIVNGLDPYEQIYFKDRSKHEAYMLYLNEVLFMLKNIKNFDSVGHIDFVCRKCKFDDKSLKYNDFSDIIDEIFKNVIAQGKGIELNTATYRPERGLSPENFDSNLVKRYKQLGGEIITIGSDAHTDNYIGYSFDYFKQILIDSGFKYSTHFEKRKPIYDKL